MKTRFLPQQIHGLLDYVVAVTLIVVPLILDFRQQSEFAHWLGVAAGAGLVLYSLATDYSLGVVSAVTIRQHLTLDAAAGILFVVLAFVAGFSAEASIFYGLIGAAVLAVVAVTELDPAPQPAIV